jgi:hypothetical protein
MTAARSPIHDALVQDVRERRREMLASFDNDLDVFYRAICRRQDDHPDLVVERRDPFVPPAKTAPDDSAV